jgi:hypothetical protein
VNPAAYTLRENTGTTGLLDSARAAVTTLADHGIPHLIVGGLAVQEYGWTGSPLRRLKDKTDVVELILRRALPRDLPVDSAVRHLYIETWDALQAEA